jgi:hypothetical protein
MKNSGVYGGSLINANPYGKQPIVIGRPLVEHAGQLLAFPIVNLPGGCTIVPIHGRHYPHFLVRQNSSERVDEYLAVFTDDRQAIELIKIGT